MNQLPCEVVSDLLPSYVDGLTNEVTGKLMRQHLESCESCRARYAAMGAPETERPDDAREIDFLKKNRRKNRRVVLWSLAGAALLAAVILLLRAFVIGSATSSDSLACRAEVQDGTTLALTGDIVDSIHVISGVRFRQEGGAVYVTVRTALSGVFRDGRLNRTYTAPQEITQVYVNGKLIWEDGVEISPLAARIFATRHDYVGDMPANRATADAIGIGDILGPFTSTLETSERPYRWILEFPVEDVETARAMETRNYSWAVNIGQVLLAAVGNLDEVQFLFIGDGYEGDLRVDAQHAGNGLEPPDIKVCGRSAAGIQRLLDAVYWQRMADWEVLNGPYWES
jgi:hypothetical protein